MNDIAFFFPGQGSQYAGMGKALAAQHLSARRIFDQADNALGFAISKLCFEGPEEELQKTENTQAALLTVSVAAYQVLEESGYRPAILAGHSLGEYSALVAAHCLEFAEALCLVRKRGRYMQEAVPEGVGSMAAILKLPPDRLDKVLEEAAQGEVVAAANFNSPDQVVIAGHAGAVQRALEIAKAAGARRTVILPVSAPFHCSLMKPAQERLRADLAAAQFQNLAIPLINNWRAQLISSGDEARHGLSEQIPNPVRWTDSVREMAQRGIKRFVEVGPGSVLTGLAKNIDPALKGAKFGEPGDLDNVKAFLG
jgi:[acyl-carrier-protein] S-malonyltransferase